MNHLIEPLKNNDRYLHHFHCNHLNSELNRILTVKCSRETISKKEERLKKLFNYKPCEEIFGEIININNEKKINIEKMMKSDELEWFKHLTAIGENLPICVTISSTMRGFPLIYTNKQFEKMTKYNKKDIIGQNCKFLQPEIIPENENIQYILMRNALENKSPISVIITNMKADGTKFQNLLALSPIKDKLDNYIYVLGIQTELNIVENVPNIEDIQNVIDVVSILSKF